MRSAALAAPVSPATKARATASPVNRAVVWMDVVFILFIGRNSFDSVCSYVRCQAQHSTSLGEGWPFFVPRVAKDGGIATTPLGTLLAGDRAWTTAFIPPK